MKTKQVMLLVLMTVLWLGGLPLLLGEPSGEWNMMTFIMIKVIGTVAMMIGYYIYTKNFKVERAR